MSDDSTHLRPFLLATVKQASTSTTVPTVVADTAAALTAAGFTVAGMYNASETCAVLVITNGDLQGLAAQSERGGFGAVLRVGVTQVQQEIQVSFTNPKYMAFAYRMASGDLAATLEATLIKALGGMERDFGSAKGLTEKKLRKYQYKIGMEYFDEPETLGKFKTFEEAVERCEASLAAAAPDVVRVCRIDVPGKKEALFCCGLQSTADKFANDNVIMAKIDLGPLKHTPHMPYEILVAENKIVMLHARFRIAISFPDLDMMGAGSFMEIMDAPKAIKKALTTASCGKQA